MKVVSIKAMVSGIVGSLGAIASAISGLSQILLPVGFGLFVLTLLIQYGSIKFKIVTTLSTLIGLSFLFANGVALP